jgi:hypothetical protein
MFATTDENAYPIYDASDMFDSNGNCILAPGSYNILMNDIELENVKPIEYGMFYTAYSSDNSITIVLRNISQNSGSNVGSKSGLNSVLGISKL